MKKVILLLVFMMTVTLSYSQIFDFDYFQNNSNATACNPFKLEANNPESIWKPSLGSPHIINDSSTDNLPAAVLTGYRDEGGNTFSESIFIEYNFQQGFNYTITVKAKINDFLTDLNVSIKNNLVITDHEGCGNEQIPSQDISFGALQDAISGTLDTTHIDRSIVLESLETGL